jgi:hypothetical protein
MQPIKMNKKIISQFLDGLATQLDVVGSNLYTLMVTYHPRILKLRNQKFPPAVKKNA